MGIPILDDLHVLVRLNEVRNQPWLDGYIQYFMGDVGALKRPVSYLSFYLQRESAASSIAPLKIVNFILHLITAGLVLLIVYSVVKFRYTEKAAIYAAILGAAYWTLSPLQASTVLYVTQRMTILSALFSFAAILLWLVYRQRQWRLKQELLWLSCISFLMLLGVLAKENAILCLVFFIVFDAILFCTVTAGKLYRPWKWGVVYGGLLALTAVFLVNYKYYFFSAFRHRDFTCWERLLTESRVLIDYLAKAVFPNAHVFGVVNNYFSKSKSLFNPPDTFYSVAAILGAILFAVCLKRFSLVRLGVLLFFSAHLLESTFLSLELYFEHRNYVPLLGVSIVLGAGVAFAIDYFSKSLRNIVLAAMAFYLALVTYKLDLEVHLWSNPLKQAAVWYNDNPRYTRAHSYLGSTLIDFGMYSHAATFYSNTAKDFPLDITKDLLWWELQCFDENLPAPHIESMRNKAVTARFYNEAIVILNALLSRIELGSCKSINVDDLILVVHDLIRNPDYKERKNSLWVLVSRLHESKGDRDAAMNALDAAIEERWRVDIALALASRLLIAGQRAKAEVVKKQIDGWCDKHFARCLNYGHDIKTLDNMFGGEQ